MQASVGSLLLLTSSVVITCIIVGYAAAITGEIMTAPQDIAIPLQQLQTTFLNQTAAAINQTQPLLPETIPESFEP